MAITNDDVKLFESQHLTDEEDGGGRVTGREVIDGNVNNRNNRKRTSTFLVDKLMGVLFLVEHIRLDVEEYGS